MEQLPLIRRLRFKQIRTFSDYLNRFANWPVLRRVIPKIGKFSWLAEALVGYHQKFPNFTAAEAYARRFEVPSHEHPSSTGTQLGFSVAARLSDYPVLFYMKELAPNIRSLLDI